MVLELTEHVFARSAMRAPFQMVLLALPLLSFSTGNLS